MFKSAKPLFMLCETPLHAGSGNELGVIDLPIQRERHTGFPKVEASGIKGCIRNSFENLNEITINETATQSKETIINLLFGPENGNEHGSALSFTDGRLLLFPVKSIKGVFAWVTCPKVLEKFRNELRFAGEIPEALKNLPKEKSTTEQSDLFVKGNKIVLEEYTLEIEKDSACSKLTKWMAENILPQDEMHEYLRNKMRKDIIVLSDDEFRDFVTLSTEVITRIKIDNEKGTVKNGALFTEEYLPAESILYSMVCASPIFSQNKEHKELFPKEEQSVMEAFHANMSEAIQLGGNASIGKGLVRVVKYNEK